MSIEVVNSIRFSKAIKSFQEWVSNDTFEEIPFETIEVFIDNENLIEHLKRYELPLAKKVGHPEMAGLYVGHDPSNLLKDVDKFDDFSSESLISLFQCKECKSATCPYDLVFKIRKDGRYVYWLDFRQQKSNYPFLGPPYTNKKSDHQKLMEVKANWDYKGFGPFTFSEENYSSALNELRKTIQTFGSPTSTRRV